MISLEKYSNEALIKELERRKLKATKPKPLKKPNLKRLKALVDNYIDFCFSDSYHTDHDYGGLIEEEAVQAFYGEDIYKNLNERM